MNVLMCACKSSLYAFTFMQEL